MNTCKYYYKEQLIGNEIQLLDFLLTKEKYIAHFGDNVFLLMSTSERALSTRKKIETDIAKRGLEADARLKLYVAKHGIDYDSTGRVINLESPAMGTNKFLSKYVHQEGPLKGRRLLPEFIEKEYWERKIHRDWPTKEFTKEEEDLICEIEGEDFREKFNDKSNLVLTLDLMEKWAKKIQEKWTAQGRIGTSLHAVSELFFGKNGDHYNFEELETNPSLIDTWYNDHFKDKMDEYGKITYGNYVNYDLFRAMVDMCSKLKKLLLEKYGNDLTFYPEFTVATDLVSPFEYYNSAKNKNETCKEIIGIIDLLVVDSQGRTHIFDYKTSPKSYGEYSTAKERGFTYQLAVYDRILQHYGIYTGDGDVNIIPIKLNNFHYNLNENKFEFDDLSYEITLDSSTKVNIKELPIKGDVRIENDLNEFLEPGTSLEVYADNLIEKVQNATHKWFPTYLLQKNMDDASIRKMIEDAGGFTPNREGELNFNFKYGFGKKITIPADDPHLEASMFLQVKEEIKSWPLKKQLVVERFKADFEEAVTNKTRFEFKHAHLGYGKNTTFLSDMITPYCNGDYTIIDNPGLLCLGGLMLQHKDGTITVLKLTGSTLNYLHEFLQGRSYLIGQYSADIDEDSKGNSLMLKATNANIEAMEAMLALQYCDYNQNYKIREIKVINPYHLTGQPVSNKELMYSYKSLLQKENVLGSETNKFKEGKIKLLSDAERLKQDFANILASDTFGGNSIKFDESVRPEMERLNSMDWTLDVSREELYDKLNDLRNLLESLYPALLKIVSRSLSDMLRPENLLYLQIMATMLELKGINVRLQIKDASNWLENTNVVKYGWEGLQLENAGNFKSPTLNLLTKSVSNVYLKVKDKVNRENAVLRRLITDLKKLSNYGWMSNNISGNPADLYKDMTYVDNDGEFLFVNPDKLTGAKKAFLEHALDVINKNRFPSSAQATLDSLKKNNDVRYYRVPLMAASDSSRLSTTGIRETIKDKLLKWTPKNALREMEEKLLGFFNDEQSASLDNALKLYEMNNLFDYGESDHRERMLLRGAENFEHNIETILLAHSYAYELRNLMNKEMPIIKASALCLSMQGAGANLKEGNVNNLLDFIENYTKGVIKNESLLDPKYREILAAAGKARKAASFLALAFSPIQFTYQSLEGIWKACSLIIRKPDGTDAFTVKHMWDSAKEAYKDLAHYSETPTKCLLTNEIYGLNDMDANLFTERINSDHSILSRFTDFAFRMSSRPDYYNRSTIFLAQMRADGSWDAHEVKNGELLYNFNKDARYKALKESPKNSTEYKEAFSRYLAALEQFKKEGVTNLDGSELKVGDDLPRAYTNQQAQAMKAIADNMYGYYNHENKSLFATTLMGGLAMQMKTYWSAKKNQFLAPGGVKLMGKYEDYKENGLQLYYLVNEKGDIDLSKPFVLDSDSNCSGVKVLQWKGQWQEGIVLTLAKLWRDGSGSSLNERWLDLWNNPDANLRRAYRSNIKHLALDLFFMIVVGNLFAAAFLPWEEDEKKQFNADPTDMGKAASYMGVKLLADSFDHSVMDFNFFDSIFSPTVEWQPFAFSSISKLLGNASKYFTTDATFANTIANSSAVTRLFKPIIKCITYNED